MELMIQGDLYVLTHDSLRFSWDKSTSWSLFVDNKELDPALEGEPIVGLCGNMDGDTQSQFIRIDHNNVSTVICIKAYMSINKCMTSLCYKDDPAVIVSKRIWLFIEIHHKPSTTSHSSSISEVITSFL